MKKIISFIAGVGLLGSTITTTTGCTVTSNIAEYHATAGFNSSELNNMFFSANNAPLIFIAFVAPNNDNKFLILENQANNSSAEKVRAFYNVTLSDLAYNEDVIIHDIKYTYTSEIFQINNQSINADHVTNIEYID